MAVISEHRWVSMEVESSIRRYKRRSDREERKLS